MNKTRLLIIIPSLLIGTALMAFLIVPLNHTLFDTLTGQRTRRLEAVRQIQIVDGPQPDVPKPLWRGRLNPAQPAPEAIREVLEDLGDALLAGNAEQVSEHFDGLRMVKEFRKAGVVQRLTKFAEPDLAEIIAKEGLPKALIQEGQLPGWRRTEVRTVELVADGREAVVIARHRDTGINKMRWWLVRRDGVWRVYDFEDVDITGIRLSGLLGSLWPVRDGRPEVARAWVKASLSIRDAAAAVRRADYAGARRTLAAMDKAPLPPLPPRLEALRWQLLAAATVAQRQHYRAVPHLDKARALNPDMPYVDLLYAAAYNETGRAQLARTHLQKYRKLVGDDCDTYYQLGLSHARLGQAREAAAAFHKCLDDDPNLSAGLLELSRILPRSKKGQLTDRLARMAQPERYFEQLALTALNARDVEAVEAYVAVFRQRNLQEPVVDTCEVWAKAQAGKVGAAVALFKKAMANMQGQQRRKDFTREFLLDLAESGDVLQAYRAAPDHLEAFAVLAASTGSIIPAAWLSVQARLSSRAANTGTGRTRRGAGQKGRDGALGEA